VLAGLLVCGVEPWQDAIGLRTIRSIVALAFFAAATACGGRQSTDQAANNHPAAGGGSAGAPNGGSGGAIGQGGSSNVTSNPHPCEFGTATAPSTTSSASPDVVQARILRFLLDGSMLPTALPPITGSGWAGTTAMQILDAATRGDVQVPPAFVKWLTSWDYNLKAPSTTQLWAYEITRPDATLSTLIATRKMWNVPHGIGYMTDLDILTGRPSIDRRGMMVLDKLLCMRIPAPPADFMTKAPVLMPGLTERASHEQAIAQAVCAACHKMMDPLGHAFGHFDRAGAYRDLDNGVPVDASDEFTTQGGATFKFSSIDDLAPQLAQSCEVAQCVAGSLLRIAIDPDGTLNVDPPFGDGDIIPIATAFADSGFSIRTLVRSIVEAPIFKR
jgi:hypothetical protein